MKFVFTLIAAASTVALSNCSAIDVLTFEADDDLSGRTKDQKVEIYYGRPATEDESCPQGSECAKFDDSDISRIIDAACTGRSLGIEPQVAPALIPLFVFGAQAGFDVAVGAIDSRRERLQKAAVQEYAATVIATDLRLSTSRPVEGKPVVNPECVIVHRMTEKNRALVLVNVLRPHSNATVAGRGLTWSTVYLRVDLAAAETARAQDGRAKIDLVEALAISAIQPNAESKSEAVELVSTATFKFSGIEVGTHYLNKDLLKDLLAEDVELPEKWKDLKVADSPLFVGLRQSPAVGAIGVAVTERGSAAALDDVNAVEKSLRAALRAAIGKSLETRLSE